jgi:hypothetical protein
MPEQINSIESNLRLQKIITNRFEKNKRLAVFVPRSEISTYNPDNLFSIPLSPDQVDKLKSEPSLDGDVDGLGIGRYWYVHFSTLKATVIIEYLVQGPFTALTIYYPLQHADKNEVPRLMMEFLALPENIIDWKHPDIE